MTADRLSVPAVGMCDCEVTWSAGILVCWRTGAPAGMPSQPEVSDAWEFGLCECDVSFSSRLVQSPEVLPTALCSCPVALTSPVPIARVSVLSHSIVEELT